MTKIKLRIKIILGSALTVTQVRWAIKNLNSIYYILYIIYLITL